MLSHTHRVRSFSVSVIALVWALTVLSASAAFAQARGTVGGFMDSATAAGQRPRLSSGEVQTFLPARGEFTFPAPYGTTGVRLTNSSDCGGNDCVNYIGYSYWNNINNHTGSDTMLIFVGLMRSRGGQGPSLFSYNKKSGETKNLGPLFSADSAYSWASGEGWYFSGSRPNALYLNDGPKLVRYDVLSHSMETVFDIRDSQGGSRYIWQIHSSYDDRVHSATVRDSGSYEMLGCVAYREDTRQALYYPKKGDYDECQIDKSGRWLVMKENLDGAYGEDNRIIDIETGNERVFLDQNGAAGHSDVGYGYMVAEDNMHSQPGATRVWRFDQDMSASGQGTLVYALSNWNAVAGMGHLTHSNARPGLAPSQQVACVSSAERANLPRVNEIVCFRLDGSMNTLVVAPNMTDLDASGGGGDDYSKRPKGNLDVTGEYFVWSSNAGTSRGDVYIVRIPQALLGTQPGSVPPVTSIPPVSSTPAPSTPAPSTPAPAPGAPASSTPAPAGALSWAMLANAAASGNSLTKTGGCGGCADAGAVSAQKVSSGGGLTFTAADTAALRFVGLGSSMSLDAASIAFALRLQNGVVEVRESGTYRTETTFTAGTTFGIVIEGATVKYTKNGGVFYTSSQAAGSSLGVSVVLFDSNATVSNIALSGSITASNVSTPPATTAPAPSPSSSAALPTAPSADEPIAESGVRKRWPADRNAR